MRTSTLGRDNTAYHITAGTHSHHLNNPAQKLTADLSPSGVRVYRGTLRWDLAVHAWGYGNTLRSVAISGDTVVVGAFVVDVGANGDQGSAYVFEQPGCGNTVVETGEQCDDGNVVNGDCCSSTCQYESAGSGCPGSTCNAGVCMTTGPPPQTEPDSDGDGLVNSGDNCPTVAHPDQTDTDHDPVGDACDNASDVFNADQSDGNGDGNGNDAADVVDSGTPPSLTVRRVLLRANTSDTAVGNGRLTLRGQFDTTELGGVDGLRDALRQGFAVGVSGAGMSETQALFFPRSVAVASCDGSNGEHASFVRRGATAVFDMRIVAQQRSFGPPLSSAPVTAVLSLGGLDRRDDASTCRVRTRGVTAGCR